MELLINIDVPDLEQAIGFYREALGLRLKRRLFENTVAEMTGAPAPIYLIARPEGSRPVPESGASRSYQRHWTPVHLDFVVENLDTAVSKALSAGARIEGRLQSFPWGTLATLSDPFGHGLCLLEWTDRNYGENVRPSSNN
jgi:predicted enzyme related to lactoylglutathione lyase